MLYFVGGDIFCTPEDVVLAHGCNCAGAMGAGIALEFKTRYPKMYSHYRAKCKNRDFWLGDVDIYTDATTGRIIANLATQEIWGKPATYYAIEKSLETLLSQPSETFPRKVLALPLVGTGLGGLDPYWVKKTIVRVCEKFSDWEVFVCVEYIEGHNLPIRGV